jgi:hypothetical protein
MRYRKCTVAFVAMAALGLSGVAEAQSRARGGDGAGRGSAIERRSGAGPRTGAGERVAPRGFANQVDRRQATQRARIRDGRQNGQLNRRELGQLRQDQRRINRLENRFGADGRYSPRERRVLDRNLDRASRNIARAKNNDRPGFGNHGSRPGFGNHGSRPGFGNHGGRSGFGDHARGWNRPGFKGRGPQQGYWPGGRRGYRPIHYEAPIEVIAPTTSASNSLEVDMGGAHASWSRSSTM